MCNNLAWPDGSCECYMQSLIEVCNNLAWPGDGFECYTQSLIAMCNSLAWPGDSCECYMKNLIAMRCNLAWSDDSCVCYLQSMTAMCGDLPRPFEQEVRERLQNNGPRSDTNNFITLNADVAGLTTRNLDNGSPDKTPPLPPPLKTPA